MKKFGMAALAALFICVGTSAWSEQNEVECKLFEEAFYEANTEEVVHDCLKKNLRRVDSVNGRNGIFSIGVGYMGNPDFIDWVYSGFNMEDLQFFHSGKTALHVAVEKQAQPQMLLRLAQRGADVNAMYDVEDSWVGFAKGTTPLHLAAFQKGSSDNIAMLIALGADRTIENRYGDDPEIVVSRYHDKGARLVLSAASGNRSLVYLSNIFVKVADATEKCSRFLTVGFYKSATPQEVAGCIQYAEARLNARDQKGRTPLHLAAAYAEDRQVVEVIIREILKDEENATDMMNARDFSGKTPLHLAAKEAKDPNVISLLVAFGADVNALVDEQKGKFWEEPRGLSALHFAAGRVDSFLFATRLLVAGAKEFQTPITKHSDGSVTGGDTALHIVVSKNDTLPDTANLLLFNRADLGAENAAGFTPLMLATTEKHNWEDWAQQTLVWDLLIYADEKSACKVSREGHTALSLAKRNPALNQPDPSGRDATVVEHLADLCGMK